MKNMGWSSVLFLAFFVILLFAMTIINPTLAEAEGGSEEIVRIGLSTQMSSVKISSEYGFTLVDPSSGNILLQCLPGQEVEVQAGTGGVFLPAQNVTVACLQAIPLPIPSGNNFLKANNYRYRGNFEIFVNPNGRLTLVNVLPVEDYLLGVVSREMSENYPLEALKAQAIAARNYTLRNKGKHGAEGFDLCSGVHCQAYSGVEREGARVTQAVQETRGEVAVYKGELINALYFSSSGGYTENAENIWGYYHPYLLGVPDFDQGSPDYQWEIEMLADDVGQKLNSAGINAGRLIGIEPVKIGVSGRIVVANVKGTDGTVEIKGEKLRTSLGLKSIPRTIRQEQPSLAEYTYSFTDNKTAWIKNGAGEVRQVNLDINPIVLNGDGQKSMLASFNVKAFGTIPGRFVFSGGGWGHAVGMSQWGARNMANQGYNYRQILQHYYTGIDIEKRY